MRPSVAHKPFQPIEQGRLRSAPFDEVPPPPNQLRWMPIPIPPSSQRTDFIDGLITMAGNGNTHTHAGVAIHIYVANRSMTDRFFYNADGEMLIVPQQGRLLLRTEMGILEAAPGEIAVIQRGIRFRVELLDKEARGYICENYGALLRFYPIWGRLARTDWRIRATFWRQWRALKTAKATFILLPSFREGYGRRPSITRL